MSLIVYFDGQYWVGVVEVWEGERLKVYRHLFGTEPKEADLWQFVHEVLPSLLVSANQTGIAVPATKRGTRVNPKRRQRQVAKELKQKGMATKSQQAMQASLSERKTVGREKIAAHKRAAARQAYELRVEKAKRKKRGK